MEQHPVPQHISSYEFRLVGDMTLGQFFRIAAGAIISLIFYATPLPGIIKWPLIIFFAFLGLALAFLPLEERPLERWILAFFKAIYSPTVFVWEKTEKLNLFAEESLPTPPPDIIAPKGKQAVDIYLQSPPPKPEGQILSAFEKTEMAFFRKIASIFLPPTPVQPTSVSNTPPRGEVRIPQTFKPKIIVERKEEEQASPTPTANIQATQVQATPGVQPLETPKSPQFSSEAAPPNPPTIPNVIVGQVLSPEGKVVEGAILEVRDSSGRPVRALKTNKLGHFLVVTPLLNGRYQLITEKEGFLFDPIIFDAKGEIIPPIAVRANTKADPINQENLSQVPTSQSIN